MAMERGLGRVGAARRTCRDLRRSRLGGVRRARARCRAARSRRRGPSGRARRPAPAGARGAVAAGRRAAARLRLRVEGRRLERWSAWRCAVMWRWLLGVLGRRGGAAQAAAQAKKRPGFWALGAVPVRTSWSPLAEMIQRPIGFGAERWRPARRVPWSALRASLNPNVQSPLPRVLTSVGHFLDRLLLRASTEGFAGPVRPPPCAGSRKRWLGAV